MSLLSLLQLTLDGREWQSVDQVGYPRDPRRKPPTTHYRLWSQPAQGGSLYREIADDRFKNWCKSSRPNISPTRLLTGSSPNSTTYDTPSTSGHLELVSLVDIYVRGGRYLYDKAYEDLYQSPTIVPENVRSLPLVFIVLAMAVRLAPEEWAGDDQTRKLSSLRLYWSCKSYTIRQVLNPARRSILIATAVQSESLELVVTRLLVSLPLRDTADGRAQCTLS